MLMVKISKPLRFLKFCMAALLGIAFACMLQVAIAYEGSPSAFAAETNKNIFVDNGGADSDVVYLSDIPYANAKVGWGSLTLDKNGVNNGGITLNVNGSATTFNKGIFAHATSAVDYDISQYSSEYSHFVTYYGLNTTNNNVGNGVKFSVFTSNDGENWELKTDEDPTPIKSGDGARQFRIDIQGVKYIRLYADANGSNASDHSVWADTKLVHEGYTDNIVRTVEDLDAEIMSRYTGGPVPEELQLTLLQRNLIAAVGQYGLRTFVEKSPDNRTMLEWFLNDEEALRLWTMGGTPNGAYVNALQVLSNLYAAHKDDLQDDTVANGVRNGDLNLHMMLALSLAHASPINLWIFNNQTSNPVTRYEIFKSMYENGKLGNPRMFANFTVEEMRWVMTAQMDDESILWLRDYTSKFGDGFQLSARFNPYNYITYRFGYSYGNPKYYAPENYDMWDKKYNLSAYNITYKSGYPKLWIVFEEGSVCGGLSKTGSNIQCAWGYPATPVGQPGHCAYIYMYDAGGGKNAWQLTNSIVANGWANTTPTLMPYGWGSGGANVTNNGTIQSASYMFLSQEAQNEYDTFEKANMLMLMAKVYRNDWDALVQIYNDAYDQEHINLDAWNGLINIALDARTNSSQEQLYDLAVQCANDMKYHPLPMYDLTRRIGAKITDPAIKAKFMMLVQSTLQAASRANSSQSIQAKEINAVANALLGYVDNRIASFSFDGADANKIVLAKSFQGSGVAWEYSLDGGSTWVEVHEDSVELTRQQIASITAANDIKVHIIGAPRQGNIFTIDITQPSLSTAGFSPNDDENRFYGTTSLTEYYISEDVDSTVVPADAVWTSFATAPNLEGNRRLFVRNRATGTQLATNYVWYTYHENIIVENRNYIEPSHLTIAEAHGGAALGAPANILDGNANTYWLTGKGALPHYVTIGLDEPRFISGFDFLPKRLNSTINVPYGLVQQFSISVSMDLTNWTDVVANGSTAKTGAGLHAETFTPVQAKYVRLTCKTAESMNNLPLGAKGLVSIADVKIYEDLAADPTPKAKVRYDISSRTNHDVVAELVNPTRPITVTNTENGATTHTFTENGSFTFQFVDEGGNQGSAEATVTWIDKTAPEMDVSFSTTEPTNNDVVATMTFSEPVVITSDGVNVLNSDGTAYDGTLTSDPADPKNITFVENDSIDITFVDEVGNVGRKTVVVDWIDREEPTGTVTYSTTDVTDQPVVATVEPDKEGVTVTSEGGATHTFDSNGNFTFEMVDAAGNMGTATANVYWIKRTPKVDVSFSPEAGTMTKGPVDVTIGLPEGYRIMNNDGKNTYTFTESGEFAFQYLDPDGMQGSYSVVVDWIDHEAPKATITYDKPTATNQAVTATLALEDPSGPVSITSQGGSSHTFDDNGEFIFEFEDALGNKGSATAKVDWIDRIPPTAELTYAMDEASGKMIVQVVNPSEEITFAEGNGTYAYDANGDYEIVFFDVAGNEGRLTVHVDVFPESLTLDACGGTWAEGYTVPTEYSSAHTFVLPGANELSRPGYVFAGWFAKDANGDLVGEAVTEIEAGSTGAVNLYAQWDPVRYSIAYDLGGDGTDSPVGIDLSAFSSYVTGEVFVLPDASVMKWDEHTFVGWFEDAGFTGRPLQEIPAGRYGDIALYAKWAGEACVVNYHENGGEFASEPRFVYEFSDGFSVGQMVELSGDIAREGYAFDGWYESADCAGSAVQGISLFVGTADFYAKWTPVEYAITYVMNEGVWVDDSNLPADSYTIESGDIALPGADDIVREGYAFKGWFTDEDLAGEAEMAVAAGSTGDKTFYAKWEQEQVTPPDPDKPGDLDPAQLKILSIAFKGVGAQAIAWDENDYARVEVRRSQMPAKSEDFTLEIPEGIACSIVKREPVAAFAIHPLARLLSRSNSLQGRADDSSDLWDITLSYAANPDYARHYTLELVPVDDEDNKGSGSDDPPTPGGSDPSDDVQPPRGSDDANQPHDPPALGGDAERNQERVGSGLAETADSTGSTLLLLIGVASASFAVACISLILRRRSRTQRDGVNG